MRVSRVYALTVPPSATADRTQGYEVGDVATYAGSIYVCASARQGAAVWRAVGTGSSVQVGPSYDKLAAAVSSSVKPAGTDSGLSVTVEAGSMYHITGMLGYDTNPITCGIELALVANGAAGTLLGEVGITVATVSTQGRAWTALDQWVGLATGTTTECSIRIDALFTCSTSGTLELWLRPEVNGNTVTLQRGYLAIEDVP